MARWFAGKRKSRESEDVAEYDVPTFPAAVHDVLRLIRADECSNAEIASGLAADPGMTVRVLRLVNSAGFGLRQPVEDVSQAVQLIGRSSLESILISAAVRDTLPGKSRHGFDAAAFWQLCAQRASIAGALANQLCPERRALCWTAGLLQDLAIPLLVEREGLPYCGLLEAWSQGVECLEALELEAFETTHAQVAEKICEQWEFPDPLRDAIANHHEHGGDGAVRPEYLVGLLRLDVDGASEELLGLEALCDEAESGGMSREKAMACVGQGLDDAAPLIALLQ